MLFCDLWSCFLGNPGVLASFFCEMSPASSCLQYVLVLRACWFGCVCVCVRNTWVFVGDLFEFAVLCVDVFLWVLVGVESPSVPVWSGVALQ